MPYMIKTSGQTKPIRAITGNWRIGISSIRLHSRM